MNQGTFEQLRSRVVEYLTNNVYYGYTRPFELEDIGSSRFNPESLTIASKGLLDEDICCRDIKWEHELAKIGLEFDVCLAISYNFYRK